MLAWLGQKQTKVGIVWRFSGEQINREGSGVEY